jgi:synaptotagmin-like protein
VAVQYEVNRSVLDSRVLWVSVWHSEQFGRNEFLGEVNLSLIDCNFDTEVLRWYKLQPKVS